MAASADFLARVALPTEVVDYRGKIIYMILPLVDKLQQNRERRCGYSREGFDVLH
jgi:hypothetical protein